MLYDSAPDWNTKWTVWAGVSRLGNCERETSGSAAQLAMADKAKRKRDM